MSAIRVGLGLILVLVPAALAPLAAHHGWGSYDATKPFTVAGPILTSKFGTSR